MVSGEDVGLAAGSTGSSGRVLLGLWELGTAPAAPARAWLGRGITLGRGEGVLPAEPWSTAQVPTEFPLRGQSWAALGAGAQQKEKSWPALGSEGQGVLCAQQKRSLQLCSSW